MTASYDQEQAQLREEYEGGSRRRGIEIEAPREPEVKPEVYKDVEPMLYRGFLTVVAEINGVPFVFKSLNHHEFELVRLVSGGFGTSSARNASWNAFLAYGVFLVNGINVLPKRDEYALKLADLFDSLPQEARDKVVRYLGELNRRAARAVAMVEAYSMEVMSRYRWLQLKGLDCTSTAVTGVEGTSRLGLNWAQQLWRAINQIEDRNDDHEREWENSKFIGSCFAGKGLSKVYTQDTERRRKEKEDRIARKDLILREHVLGERPQTVKGLVAGAVMVGPKTVEELADQLAKDLRGEQDEHDRVVAAYESRIRQAHTERQAEIAAQAVEAEREFGGRGVVGTTLREGMTEAQAREYGESRKQLLAQAAARLQLRQATTDEQTAERMERWGLEDTSTQPPTKDE